MDSRLHAHAASLTVQTSACEGVPIVAVSGEIDVTNEEAVESEVRSQLDQRSPLLVLDLRKVTYLDSAGIRLLLASNLDAIRNGTKLVIVADHHAVLQPLAITELDQVLELHRELP